MLCTQLKPELIYSCIFTDSLSSSEFIVDEESILQLFKTCRECSRKCLVRKHVKGLKLVVYQTCRFCQSHRTWTNLPDEDDDHFQINGKDAVHGQTSSATSPSSNTSWDSTMTEITLQVDSDCTEKPVTQWTGHLVTLMPLWSLVVHTSENHLMQVNGWLSQLAGNNIHTTAKWVGQRKENTWF